MQVSVWRDQAACQGLEPAIFYPADEVQAASAKTVCEECLVQTPCLEYALDRRERDGVWGGCTEKERRRIQRQRRRAS
ncbi:MAG TPA: WhiB family transcriptional regulator [Acidimicrobiales bacterium]|nr:WhiB family transcriptional regulator [Acidimicrobiales bacterium]